MAIVGLRYAVFSRMQSHTEGSLPTYDVGKVIGMNTQTDVAITRNSANLPADDVDAEEDNGISSAQITMSLDDLTLENEAYVIGTVQEGSGDNAAFDDVDGASPLGGLGYVRVREKTDQATGQTNRSYIATWWFKVRGRIDNENTTTKNPQQATNWQTSTLIFKALGAFVSGTEKMRFRRRKQFSTYEAAKAFIDGFANLTTQQGAQQGG